MYYSCEQNTLMTISLLKAHNIKDIVVSPGGTNVCFTTSLSNDPFFNLYSCVDERSAAYMACGIAEETGEPVGICCTGATASRNYVPALTEAFYRKLPILVITTSQHEGKVGHLFPQVTDRSQQMNDILKYSTHIPALIESKMDRWTYNVEINKAIIALRRNGGGPSHINLATESSVDFSVTNLPEQRVIHYYEDTNMFPEITSKNISIFVGNHKIWNEKLTKAVEEFCSKYNAVVLADHTSNYHGKYKAEACIVTTQAEYSSSLSEIDLLIHIGDVSGAYMNLQPKNVWRVNPDGEICDTFFKLNSVFNTSEESFFEFYNSKKEECVKNSTLTLWEKEINDMRKEIDNLPFSNAWVAQQTTCKLPNDCEVHFGILNTLRTWNYFHIDNSVNCFCNTGGFGIDGCLSSAIGSSFINQEKIYYCILGDLAFFYDMNCIGNRHISNNLRVILVNNGCGAEFHIPACVTKRAGLQKEEINKYTAAYGHYGVKSPLLVMHMAEDLGFKYISIHSKEEYLANLDTIINPNLCDKPLFVEIFTEADDDAYSMKILTTLKKSTTGSAKQIIKNIIGTKNIQKVKGALGK